jgi:hypothetical protein
VRPRAAQEFTLLEKLGEGSFGTVYKGARIETNELVAVKIIPIEADYAEVRHEIEILRQCDSEDIVKYLGSYFKDGDLWIVMEYCEGSSLNDLMAVRGGGLVENQIACVIAGTLRGLSYLHSKRKIHRDVKAGNILLTGRGQVKLADFGVSAQISSTMSRRHTVIGTPFWMAPEVIQEASYDHLADVWSLGITAIELAEARPPYSDVHPLRAIFVIPTRPPPTLAEPDKWSPEFHDFVAQCLVKDPRKRTGTAQLSRHPFVLKAQGGHDGALAQLVAENAAALARAREAQAEAEEKQRERERARQRRDGTLRVVEGGSDMEGSDGGGADDGGSVRARGRHAASNASGTMCFSGSSAPSEPSGTVVIHEERERPEHKLGTIVIAEGSADGEAGVGAETDRSEWPKFMLNMNWLGFPQQQPAKANAPPPPAPVQPKPATDSKASEGGPSRADAPPAKRAEGRKVQIQTPPRPAGQPLPGSVLARVEKRDKAAAKAKYDFSGKSLEEIEVQLATLDEQLERDIATLRRKYQKRRKALNAAKLGKTAEAQKPAPAAPS